MEFLHGGGSDMPDDIAPDTSRAQEQNPEFWKDYAMAALEKWRETERSVTHTAALMLLLAALFELIKPTKCG